MDEGKPMQTEKKDLSSDEDTTSQKPTSDQDSTEADGGQYQTLNQFVIHQMIRGACNRFHFWR